MKRLVLDQTPKISPSLLSLRDRLDPVWDHVLKAIIVALFIAIAIAYYIIWQHEVNTPTLIEENNTVLCAAMVEAFQQFTL